MAAAAFLAALLVAVSSGSAARAQSVVVIVPPALEGGAAADDAEFALDLVSQRLRDDGYNVVSHGQAASAMAALAEDGEETEVEPHECTSLDCAVRFREFFDAEASLRLLLSGGEGEVARVAITLVESDSGQWTGGALLQQGQLERATLHALAVARRRRAERRGPWLTVEGTPRGAEVRVDGELVGTMPYDGRATPGEHRVEVSAPGHESARLAVRLPVRSMAERRARVTLAEAAPVLAGSAGEAGADEALRRDLPPAERQGTALYDYVVGGAMIAGGLVLAVAIPSATAARSGECSNGARNLVDCPQVYDVDGATWGQFAAGVALIGGGVAVVATRPIQLMLGGDQRSAMVGVRGRF